LKSFEREFRRFRSQAMKHLCDNGISAEQKEIIEKDVAT
jgi:hypothetical protein